MLGSLGQVCTLLQCSQQSSWGGGCGSKLHPPEPAAPSIRIVTGQALPRVCGSSLITTGHLLGLCLGGPWLLYVPFIQG